MKIITNISSALFWVAIIILIGFGYYFFKKSSEHEKEIHSFLSSYIITVIKPWDIQALPNYLDHKPNEEELKIFRLYSALGKYNNCNFSLDIEYPDKIAIVKAACNFSNSPATLDLTLVHKKNKWLISKHGITSSLFKIGL